jgi:hypothetical protein
MRATAIFAVSMLSMVALGCNGAAGELSSLECDCEHCNDWEEDESLDQYQRDQEVADAYGCGDQWDEAMTCLIEQGSCDETEARWEYPDSGGSCTGTMDTGVPCMTDAECTAGPGGGTCSAAMTCVINTCAGNGQPCATNSDCPGTNPCASAQTRLHDCQQKASAH